MVRTPARTGVAISCSHDCTSTVQAIRGILWSRMPGARMLRMVTMKLIAPMIEETPTTCRPRIHMSTPRPGEKKPPERGGYSVQPAAAAPPKKKLDIIIRAPKGSIQKAMAFRRGKAMSRAPIMMGTVKLAKPTSKGMTAKKIMPEACMVTIWLYWSGVSRVLPGKSSCARTRRAKKPASMKKKNAVKMYMMPIFL
ncbi:hypothetical protein D3C87_1465990 [compost metagenome]